MSINVMADNGVSIPASSDGALYNSLTGNRDYVIKGIGGELAVSGSGGSYTVATGEAVICGRHVVVTASESVSGSGTIALQVDLSQPAGSEGSIVVIPSATPLQTDDLNNGGTIRQMALYANGADARKYNSAAVKTFNTITVSGTPSSGASPAWDSNGDYTYSLNVSISGISSSDIVLNFVADMTIFNAVAPIIQTNDGSITLYTTDGTALSGVIQTISVIGA